MDMYIYTSIRWIITTLIYHQPSNLNHDRDLKARIRMQEMEVQRWANKVEILEEQERALSEDLALL